MPERSHFSHSRKIGLVLMLAACLLFSMMNVCVYAIHRADSTVSAIVISFIRVVINGLLLMIPALFKGNSVGLFGDFRISLWLRGLFGAAALMLSFSSIARIGPGESAFLGASSGVFVALLSPWVLKQKNSLRTWLAIVGAFVGVSLLFKETNDAHDVLGRAMALGSGFLAALAYLMVARAGRTNSTEVVVFYFCLVALFLHGGYFALYGYQLPTDAKVWGLLMFTGLAGSGAQHAMTRAYQVTPAALVSAVGYLTPVLSLWWGVVLYGLIPNESAVLGSALILLFGVLLPFLR